MSRNVARTTSGLGNLGEGESISDGIQEGVMEMLACESLVRFSGWWRTVRAAQAGDTESVMVGGHIKTGL